MRRFGKVCGVAALMLAVLVLIASDTRGQFPARPGGGGPPGMGGAPDPDAIFNMLSKGQNQINLNDPANTWMKASRERKGQPIPPNGIITRDMFKTEFQQQMAQRGGGGFGGKGDRGDRGGRDGGFGGRFGGPPGAMPATPGTPGVTPAGPGGFPGGGAGAPGGDPNQMADSFFQRRDRNGDGKITADEMDDRIRGSLPQYDKNGDGAIDQTEYRVYMTDRMSGRGGPGGGPPGFGGQPGTPQPFAFPPPQGNFQGGAFPGGGDGNREDRKDRRRGNDDDEDARPVVYRYGKLPKEIPTWFEKYDTDRDGMVGLYEWRRATEKTDKFVEMDLNGDGYLTADEWLRFTKQQLEKKPGDDDEEGGGGPAITRFGPAEGSKGEGFKMEFKGKGGDGKGPPRSIGGGDKGGREKGGNKGEKGAKRNPFTGG